MKVFICYRREDSQHQTGRLYDRLELEFGAANVFKDVDSVPVGSDFRLVLRSAVDRCDVVLVMIGDSWLDITDAAGSRRIDDLNDFVRIEIEWALKRNIAVVPVLVGNRSMPSRDELPKSIQSFAFRHGVALRPDPFFRSDVALLVNQLKLIDRNKTKERFPAGGPPSSSDSTTAVPPKESSEMLEAPWARPSADTREVPSAPPVSSSTVPPSGHRPTLVDPRSTAPAKSFYPGQTAMERPMASQVPTLVPSAPEHSSSEHATPVAPKAFPYQMLICHLVMAIVASLGMIFSLSNYISSKPTVTEQPAASPILSNVVFCFIPSCLSFFSFIGAIASLSRRYYLLAHLGAYALVIPCVGPVFGIALPLGIWSIVLLYQPTVRASFR